MFSVNRTMIFALGYGLLLSACGGDKTASAPHAEAAAEAGKVLNLYIWSDYMAPTTLPRFEKQTGIKVNAVYYDTNEALVIKVIGDAVDSVKWVASGTLVTVS